MAQKEEEAEGRLLVSISALSAHTPMAWDPSARAGHGSPKLMASWADEGGEHLDSP